MIAYYFPPLGGIGSLRAAEFAKHLREFGWEPTVIAPREGSFYEDRESGFPEEHVIRARSIELSRMGKRALGIDAPPSSGGSGRTGPSALLRSAAHRFLYRPDPQIGWYPGAVRAALKAIRSGHFDAIFSTSVPMTAHMVGRRLHGSSGLPWIAEFRDPWPESPSLQKLERSVAAKATELVMTSPTWAREHAAKWRRPVTPILAGTIRIPPSTPPTDLVVTYLGSFYPDIQELSAAWTGIRRLIDQGELGSIRIRFIGEIPTPVRQQLEQHDLVDRTEETGFVSHEKALKLLTDSSVLIAAGPRDTRESLRGWIPAKLLEYLSTDVPIIYVSQTPNDGADLLGRYSGTQVVAVDDPNVFTQALLTSCGSRFKRDVAALSWRSRARDLTAILDRAVGEGR
jgi:hypothetical protein